MAEPTRKSIPMEQALQNIFGFDRRECIKNNVCVPEPIGCGGPATSFDSELEEREYQISGLCNDCQKKVFVDEPVY